MESRFSSRYRESLRPSQTCKCTREYLFRTLHKKGRFSSRYRILPQTHADVLKHLWLPIPHSPVVKSCLPPIISGVPRRTEVPRTSFSALSSRWRGLSASDVLAPLLTPLTLWRNPPRRTGNRRTGCGITFQSNCHSPCAGLSPAIPI